MKTKAAVLATVFLLLASATAQEVPDHRFFDRQNVALFSGVAIARGMDCDSTWKVLDHPWGREDILPPSLAKSRVQMSLFSAGMVGVQIGGSYVLHRAGWHRAERWTALLHMTSTGATAIHNYRLKLH